MRIKHQVEAPELEEVKERIRESRLTTVVITVALTVVAVRVVNRPAQIVIVNNS